ncbi:MAG: hypothetical protein ACUVV0_12595 [Anaerolineae bacterium]
MTTRVLRVIFQNLTAEQGSFHIGYRNFVCLPLPLSVGGEFIIAGENLFSNPFYHDYNIV